MIGDISNRKRYDFILSCLHEISANLPNPMNILDIGCARGDIELFLGEHGFCNITGIDIDPDSINIAKQRCQKYNHIFFETSVEDFIESTDNRKWDCIICSEVLEHLKQPEYLIKNLRSLLKNNGILIISVPNGYGPWELYHRMSERKHYRLIADQPPGKYHLQRFTFDKVISLFYSNGFILRKFNKSNFISHVWPFTILGYHSVDVLEKTDCFAVNYLPKSLASGWYFCFDLKA